MGKKTAAFAAALIVGIGANAAAQNTYKVQSAAVVVHCPMTVGGSFEAKTSAASGELTHDPSSGTITGSLAVDLATIDTGIELRNRHLRENYLEVARGDGFAQVVLSEIALAAGSVVPGPGEVGFTGKLLLHGVTKPVSGTAKVTANGSGLTVEGSFPLAIPDFEIAKPRHLGIGVKDQIKIEVKLELSSAASAPPVAGGAP